MLGWQYCIIYTSLKWFWTYTSLPWYKRVARPFAIKVTNGNVNWQTRLCYLCLPVCLSSVFLLRLSSLYVAFLSSFRLDMGSFWLDISDTRPDSLVIAWAFFTLWILSYRAFFTSVSWGDLWGSIASSAISGSVTNWYYNDSSTNVTLYGRDSSFRETCQYFSLNIPYFHCPLFYHAIFHILFKGVDNNWEMIISMDTSILDYECLTTLHLQHDNLLQLIN